MVYLTRKEHFNAAHKLYNPKWSKEENEERFGLCANEYFHGHNYEVYVTVKGKPHPDTGFVMDAKELGSLIKEKICNVFDHKNMNTQIALLDGIMPTTENVTMVIFNELKQYITECELHCVKLVETETIYAEYYGE